MIFFVRGDSLDKLCPQVSSAKRTRHQQRARSAPSHGEYLSCLYSACVMLTRICPHEASLSQPKDPPSRRSASASTTTAGDSATTPSTSTASLAGSRRDRSVRWTTGTGSFRNMAVRRPLGRSCREETVRLWSDHVVKKPCAYGQIALGDGRLLGTRAPRRSPLFSVIYGCHTKQT